MALDKSVVKQIAIQTGMQGVLIDAGCLFNYPDKQLQDFAQAIYALDVKDERERLAKQFDEAGWHPYAEVIRNSNKD